MLPLVQRELRVGARNPKLYKWRIRIAVIQLLIAAILLVSDNPAKIRRAGGFSFFWFFSWCAFLFCLLDGIRRGADSISEEKREGTLGFLFLTEMSGWDVVTGKVAGSLLRSFTVLLLFMPLLTLNVLLGGTTGGEIWRVILALPLTLWFSLSLSTLVSSCTRDRSVSTAAVFLVGAALLPYGIQFLFHLSGANAFDLDYIGAASPFTLLASTSDSGYTRNPWLFATAAASAATSGFLFLWLAAIFTKRSWRNEAQVVQKIRRRSGERTPEADAARARLLDANPVFWLAYNPRRHRNFNLLFFGTLLAVVSLGLFFEMSVESLANLTLFITGLVVQGTLASQSSANLAESRSNGALELLLSTPLKVADINAGQWMAIRKMVLWPAVTTGVVCVIGLIAASRHGLSTNAIVMGKMLCETIFGIFVVGWVGMWMGLSSTSPNRAFFKTLGLAIVLPFIFCLPTLVNQAILFYLARGKVTQKFRRFVAERYLQNPEFILPPVEPASSTLPPVIR